MKRKYLDENMAVSGNNLYIDNDRQQDTQDKHIYNSLNLNLIRINMLKDSDKANLHMILMNLE